MTSTEARTVTNLVLASAGVAVAYVVLTKPPLRRLVFRLVRVWLGGSVPAFLVAETRKAWVASAAPPAASAPDIMPL